MGLINAEVAELADAHGSGPCDSNIMRVQVPSSALKGYFFDEKYVSDKKVRRFLKSPYFFCLRNRCNLFYEQFF